MFFASHSQQPFDACYMRRRLTNAYVILNKVAIFEVPTVVHEA